MKNLQDWITVKRLYKAGTPIKKIARDLNMSKNTVRRMIRLEKEPKYTREYYETKIDQYKDKIDMWYLDSQFNFNGTRIYRELKKVGYTGSISPIYRYLNTLGIEKQKIISKATVRIETPLGDQAQFDWSPYVVKIGDKETTVYCFTMILAASRRKAIVFSKRVDGDSIYEAIYELYRDLGGVTKELLIDNPKALVISNNPDKEVVFNENALRLSTYLGFEFNACNPYRARTKGKIEKPYQYIEEQFIKGNTFDSMRELNKQAKAFIAEWNTQQNGTTKRSPDEVFKEEIEYLVPIKKEKFIISLLKDRKVSLDLLISVNANKYSVPAEYAGKIVKVRIVYGYKLEILDNKLQVICEHEIVESKGIVSATESHYDPLTNKVPKSIPEVRRQFEGTFKNGVAYYNILLKNSKQPSFHVREFLKLKDLYSVESLDSILEHCLENNIFSIDGIKESIKNNYLDIINKNFKTDVQLTQTNGLERDLSYYEEGQN